MPTKINREELVARYMEAMKQFAAADRVLMDHLKAGTTPTLASRKLKRMHARVVELRRDLWPGWMQS